MHWLFYTLLAIAVIYLLLVLVIYRSNTFIGKLPFTIATPEEFFTNQSPACLAYHQDMLANGFQIHTLLNGNYNDIDCHIVAYKEHPEAPFFAILNGLTQRTINKRVDYIELSEIYSDGSALSISNMQEPYPCPHNPDHPRLPFPEQSVVELRKRLETLRGNRQPDPTAVNELRTWPAADILNKYTKREVQYPIARHWYKAERNVAGEHPITFWGALNLTWRCLPILNRLLFKYQCRRAQRLLAQAQTR